MAARFTLGIEEEFQMVQHETGQLVSCIHDVLPRAIPLLGEHIKAENHQSTVELVSSVFPDIAAARLEMCELRAKLASVLAGMGLALISAGTHPSARWQDQKTTAYERYSILEEEFQEAARSTLVYGLHVHVGVGNLELAVALMNQARTWLPHLLALSTNSPFWAGSCTGIKSYRSIVWRRIARSGIPELFSSYRDFHYYIQSLVRAGYIDNGRKIWWDVRPHPVFPTLEFRVCDMPATLDDTIALAALCQAIVAKLAWLYRRNMSTVALPGYFIEEHKWYAARYGLDADAFDFVQNRYLSMRESIHELLDFVDDVLDDLGSRREINYLRLLLNSPGGTGADRQIVIHKETGSTEAVIQHLMQQTMQGIPVDVSQSARIS